MFLAAQPGGAILSHILADSLRTPGGRVVTPILTIYLHLSKRRL